MKKLLSLWGMPSLLALLTLFGLFAALLGMGIWHVLSWLALTIPLVVIIVYTLLKRGS